MASNLPDIPIDVLNKAKASLLLLLGLETINPAIEKFLQTGHLDLTAIPGEIGGQLAAMIAAAERPIGAVILEALLGGATGLQLSDADGAQEGPAVRMLQRLLGFATVLPFATAEAHIVLKAALGNNAPEALLKAIDELPGELGVNFFIGTILERIFEVAVARPLDEAIAKQTRPARLDYREIRALLKGHALQPGDAEDRLAKAGYRDEDIQLLKQLDRTFLSMGDIQQLYLAGDWDAGQAESYLQLLGFSDADRAALFDIYFAKADTAGGEQLRLVAQQGYLDGHISEGQYRELLKQSNVPERSIDLEIVAANLRLDFGRKALSVAQIRQLVHDGHESDKSAIGRLLQMGYGEQDATELVASWHDAHTTAEKTLTAHQVIAYLRGGLIDPAAAYDKLVALGYTTADARFLVSHPAATASAAAHPLTPATVISALKDGVIDAVKAKALLEQLQVDPQQIELELSIAATSVARGKKRPTGSKTLSEAQVIQAFNLGLATQPWTVRELVAMGYSEPNAHLLVAIELVKTSGKVPAGWRELS